MLMIWVTEDSIYKENCRKGTITHPQLGFCAQQAADIPQFYSHHRVLFHKFQISDDVSLLLIFSATIHSLCVIASRKLVDVFVEM